MSTYKKNYPWVVMLVCCIYAGATIGIGTNCGGIFMPVMAEEFGVGLGVIASQMTLMSVAMAVGAIWVGRVINRMDIRVLMTLSAALIGLGFISQSFVRDLWQYYLTGILLGFGFSMGSFMTITVIMNNWFVKNRGAVIGVTLSVSSVVGIIMNPLLNSMIESRGWRLAVALKGGLLLLTIPLVWLFIRMHPREKGTVPWGAEDEEPEEKIGEASAAPAPSDPPRHFRPAPVLMMVVFAFVFTICMNHSGHLQNIAASAGFSSNIGAMMVSAYLAGEFAGKLCIGWLNDKYGINRAVFLVVAVGMLGIAGLFFVEELGPNFGLLCALLFGPMTATTSVGFTLIANNTFGPELYPRYYPYMSIASTVAFSIGSPIIGFMYDLSGTWALSYGIVLGGLVLALALLKLSTGMMAGEIKKQAA